MGKLTAKLLLWLFHGLFLFVLFLIFIGELTQKIIVYPFLYSYKGLQKLVTFVRTFKQSIPTSIIKPVEESENSSNKAVIEESAIDTESDADTVKTIKINYELSHQEKQNEITTIVPKLENPFKDIQLPKVSVPFPDIFAVFKNINYSGITNLFKNISEDLQIKTKDIRTAGKGTIAKGTKSTWTLLKQSLSFIVLGVVSACGITLKSIYIVLKEIILGIAKIPLYIFYIIKELVYYVYSILKGIVFGIFAFYRYITSPYFRSFLLGFIFCVLVVIAYQSYLFVSDLPSPTTIGKVNFAQSTHLFDRNGKKLYEIYRDVNRTSIDLEDLPEHVIQATIAIEDKNFYHHRGISFFGGILRAARDTIKTNELQGGSTITQQLVKSALLTPERTVERKLKEIVLAIWTEQIYTKDQILEMYINQVPYGGSAYGIEEASKVYLGKSAKELTLSEAALLAGLPQAPSLYSPFINPKLALQRRNDVLKSMNALGYISASQKELAMNSKVNILTPETNIRAPHFVFFTRTELEKEFGIKKVEQRQYLHLDRLVPIHQVVDHADGVVAVDGGIGQVCLEGRIRLQVQRFCYPPGKQQHRIRFGVFVDCLCRNIAR